ncbi:hypothetical protein ESCO_000823 [Escovopsis weberi]|uniref:Uncharacterized protein n=1 Tax=Escovopsis weberi TaxID=150374 RepID=A0A0M8N335_ESCWE|nr:hypothetical protein ESCO_000823 [Escovopsis weberi]
MLLVSSLVIEGDWERRVDRKWQQQREGTGERIWRAAVESTTRKRDLGNICNGISIIIGGTETRGVCAIA